MTTTELAPRTNGKGAAALEQVIVGGDLAKLSPEQRLSFYQEVCRSLNLNPLTKPFEYLELNGKLTLYARRDATDQLRSIRGISVQIVSREVVDGVYVVTARATSADGRSDEAIGAVPLVREDGEWKSAQSGKRYFQGNGTFLPLGPEDRANAMMKAETKSKRRVTLSISGLGFLDESELETIKDAQRVVVQETGEIQESPGPKTARAYYFELVDLAHQHGHQDWAEVLDLHASEADVKEKGKALKAKLVAAGLLAAPAAAASAGR